MLDAFSVFRRYLALKLHFTSDYDIKKHRGKVKFPREKFDLRNDQHIFTKLGRDYPNEKDVIYYFVANFVSGDRNGGVYDVTIGTNTYKEWKARTQSLTYKFKQDLETLEEMCSKPATNFLYQISDTTNGHPIILKAYLGQKVMVETLVILERCVKLLSQLNTTLAGDLFWEEVFPLINNYKPFLKFDVEQMSKLINEKSKEG